MKARNVETITVGRKPLSPDRLQSFEGETNPWLFTARVLALHVYPETRHFTVETDWSDYKGMESGILNVQCTAADCTKERTATYVIPIELVGAATVAFHSAHEGHPLELSWNGVKFHPSGGG